MAKNPILTGTDQQPLPFELSMSDDALVTLGGPVPTGGISFLDVGFMPVNELTIGGNLQYLKGKLDGMFIRYTGEGVQTFASGAPPTVEYMSLHYELMGYKGDATFGHAADGTPTVSDAKHLTVLAQGDLIPGTGHLGFGTDGGITGQMKTSMQINGQPVGTLDISVQHSSSDIRYPTRGSMTLDGGTLQATFVPLSVG